jgi:phosphotransferase system HPr (HPr) family protein
MQKKKVKVKIPHGIHLRPASELCKLVQQSGAKVTICHDCQEADSCSILQIMSLGLSENAEIEIVVEGASEDETIKKMSEFFEGGGGI